ncbi:MAG: hypothetical protein V7K14_05305 [Nostoc sp.]|uniref:hypothetical protein n=1 Tax=Nostoc sp. TaxID=1180 RepID=UPI002FF9A380
MKSFLLGLVLVMSAVLPAAAENWVDINKEGIHPVVMDADSILTNHNGSYNFWIMRNDGQGIHQLNAVIDCRERTMVFIAYKNFTATGKLIESFSYDNSVPTSIKVDSNGSICYDYLCH